MYLGEVLKPECMNLKVMHLLKIMVCGCMTHSGTVKDSEQFAGDEDLTQLRIVTKLITD